MGPPIAFLAENGDIMFLNLKKHPMRDARILLYALVIFIFVGLIGLVGMQMLGYSPVLEMLEIWGFRLALLGSLIVLAAHSTLFKSWKAILVVPGLVVGLGGALFKIMHWPLANNMLLLGGGALLLGYTIRFALKRPINRNDVLKWLFVVFYCVFALGTIFHLADFFREWAFVSRILLLVTAIDFLIARGYLKPKLKPEGAAL